MENPLKSSCFSTGFWFVALRVTRNQPLFWRIFIKYRKPSISTIPTGSAIRGVRTKPATIYVTKDTAATEIA